MPLITIVGSFVFRYSIAWIVLIAEHDGGRTMSSEAPRDSIAH